LDYLLINIKTYFKILFFRFFKWTATPVLLFTVRMGNLVEPLKTEVGRREESHRQIEFYWFVSTKIGQELMKQSFGMALVQQKDKREERTV